MGPKITTEENTGAEPVSPKGRNRLRRLGALTIAAAAVLALLVATSAPKNFPEKGGVFTVEQGTTLVSLGTRLAAQGYVRSTFLFDSLVTLFGGERRITSGDYFFSPRENVVVVAWQIATGRHNLHLVKVTVPEGKNVREMSAIYAGKLAGFDTDTFMATAKPLEGYLFPETYFFYPNAKPDDVVKRMQDMFDQQTTDLFAQGIPAGRTKSDIVTMASIVEREAHGDDDRAMIAGILWNRIARGMRLQVDATVAYANNVADSAVTPSMIAAESPYNTYRHAGLPPGPIGNPGLASLQAALNPAKTDYLYYIHDSHGSIHYAKTFAEHEANIAKYLK